MTAHELQPNVHKVVIKAGQEIQTLANSVQFTTDEKYKDNDFVVKNIDNMTAFVKALVVPPKQCTFSSISKQQLDLARPWAYITVYQWLKKNMSTILSEVKTKMVTLSEIALNDDRQAIVNKMEQLKSILDTIPDVDFVKGRK